MAVINDKNNSVSWTEFEQKQDIHRNSNIKKWDEYEGENSVNVTAPVLEVEESHHALKLHTEQN